MYVSLFKYQIQSLEILNSSAKVLDCHFSLKSLSTSFRVRLWQCILGGIWVRHKHVCKLMWNMTYLITYILLVRQKLLWQGVFFRDLIHKKHCNTLRFVSRYSAWYFLSKFYAARNMMNCPAIQGHLKGGPVFPPAFELSTVLARNLWGYACPNVDIWENKNKRNKILIYIIIYKLYLYNFTYIYNLNI